MAETKTDTAPAEAAEQARPDVRYSASPGLFGFLASRQVSFAFTSYQSGKLYLVGHNPAAGLTVDERFFQRAMGLAVDGRQTIWLAALAQILRFEDTLATDEFINNTYDACYVPRATWFTGDLDIHDLGVTAGGEVVFVNTRYNCLATPSKTRSFRPVWKPSFIDRIVAEDRCHLNGLAMNDGKPAYVTAVSRSNTIDGWRDRRADGGIIIDVASGEVVCEGLSMPHSPRIWNGRLWVLNSGTGELGWVDTQARSFNPVAFCPGFVRGLGFHGQYAFVGLSKPRYERFEGLALDARLKEADSEPWCGVQVIDLSKGTCAQWLRIDGAVAELYDVSVIPGARTPMAVGFGTADLATLITHEAMADMPD